jgi:hypothetical protein
MSEKSERALFLPFVSSERNRMPERQTIARQPISYARSSNNTPVLNFRSKPAPIEPEDARITGATRSLYRRLLALNLRKPVASLRETEAYIPRLTA